jgi:hypothetical protein
MTADLGQSRSPAEPPISDSAARQIANGFMVSVADVVLDAERVAGWNAPADDLLVWLARRHGWPARGALAYLLSLRNALHLHAGEGPAG